MRWLRGARGLSGAEAAKRAGFSSPRRLGAYEGRSYPRGDAIAILAQVYEVPMAELAQVTIFYSDPDMYQCLWGDQTCTLHEAFRSAIGAS
ncbi:helix-turn-helix transcriptional regulator [Amorphus sp. 3PC139-8]